MAIGKVIKGDGIPDNTNSGDRGSSDQRRRGGVVNAEVFEAHQEAQNIIESAQKRAAEIIEEAQGEREQVIAKSEAEGREEGLRKITEEFAKAHLQRGAMISETQDQLVKLSLKIAEKIIGKDLERDPALVMNICATAVETVRNSKSMILRVNPKDAQLLRDRRKQMMELIGRVKDISFKEDPDVQSGGCIIETDSGTVDAQLSTQLEMLLHVLVPDTARKEPR